MHDLLIPFGIHKDTGDIIEPEDAVKGRACDCLCPGCKAPLLCKHPKEKRDHFAHDSKHENAKPEKKCPFSSSVAVAMMVRNMAPAFVGKLLGTPEFYVSDRCPRCRRLESIMVTRSAYNRIDEVDANVTAYGHHVDLKLIVSGFPILVNLVYKGKQPLNIDETALQSNKVAVLELDCDSFSFTTFRRHRKLRFSEAIIRFFLIEGRRAWRFHPRAETLRKQSQQKHQCKTRNARIPQNYFTDTPTKSVLPPEKHTKNVKKNNIFEEFVQHQEKQKAEKPVHSPENSEIEKSVHNPEVHEVKKPVHSPEETVIENDVIKRFECVLCHLSWQHHGHGSWKCPNCDSHLYAREIKE